MFMYRELWSWNGLGCGMPYPLQLELITRVGGCCGCRVVVQTTPTPSTSDQASTAQVAAKTTK